MKIDNVNNLDVYLNIKSTKHILRHSHKDLMRLDLYVNRFVCLQEKEKINDVVLQVIDVLDNTKNDYIEFFHFSKILRDKCRSNELKSKQDDEIISIIERLFKREDFIHGKKILNYSRKNTFTRMFLQCFTNHSH